MKFTILFLTLGAFLMGFVAFLVSSPTDDGSGGGETNNVTFSEGKQVVEILAKGGYFPRVTSVKAGVPTELRVRTNGTFDCSAALMIPNIQYRSILPQSGETAIVLPPQSAGSTVRGLCWMGMYFFELRFT